MNNDDDDDEDDGENKTLTCPRRCPQKAFHCAHQHTCRTCHQRTVHIMMLYCGDVSLITVMMMMTMMMMTTWTPMMEKMSQKTRQTRRTLMMDGIAYIRAFTTI